MGNLLDWKTILFLQAEMTLKLSEFLATAHCGKRKNDLTCFSISVALGSGTSFSLLQKGLYGLKFEITNSVWNKIINLTMVTFVYGNYTN